MFTSQTFKIVVLAVSCLACFYGGYRYRSTSCNLQLAQIHIGALEEQTKATILKQDKENAYNLSLSNTQSTLASDVSQVVSDYNNLVSNSVFSSTFDNTHGLQQSDIHSSSNSNLSNAPTSPSTVQTCDCISSQRYRAKLQRVYDRQLEISRDCDIDRAYYNRLREFYLEVSAQ